jgi:hypothetical protein
MFIDDRLIGMHQEFHQRRGFMGLAAGEVARQGMPLVIAKQVNLRGKAAVRAA